jgi:predicted PolB exonuclease-like 3'-5' exonuclease
MTATLAFHIKTIPDTDGLRILYDLPQDTSAKDVANIAYHQARQQHGTEFLPLYQQRICAISCVLRAGENLKVWSLASNNAPEAEIIQSFFAVIDQYKPQIISWNGNAFDLPVLHYRALIHGVNASAYWALYGVDLGINGHSPVCHLDLMAKLDAFSHHTNTALNDLAKLCGFSGQSSLDGAKLWDIYKAGGIDAIRADGEVAVTNIQLLYLRFQLMRGQLSHAAYEAEIKLLA